MVVNKSSLSLMPSHRQHRTSASLPVLQSGGGGLGGEGSSGRGGWQPRKIGTRPGSSVSDSGLKDPVGMTWPRCHNDKLGGCGTQPQVSSPPGSLASLGPITVATAKFHPTGGDKPDWKGNRRCSKTLQGPKQGKPCCQG